MNVLLLALRELRLRFRRFLLATLVIAIAAGGPTILQEMLRVHDAADAQLQLQRESDLKASLAKIKDDMRKAMLKLSFNCVVLPEKQDLEEWHLQGFGTTTMPEDYVHQLADSKIVSVRHFLPVLQRRIFWPEAKRTVLLVGSRGEVPNLHKKPKAPMVQPVPEGSVVLGFELHRSLGLKVGDSTTILGREFRVSRCHESRGSKDDISLWIPLRDAQELLKQPAQINAILALECICVGESSLGKVRADITKHLPQTKVLEMGTRIVTRAEARTKLGKVAKQLVAEEKKARTELRNQRLKTGKTIFIGTGVVAILLLIVFSTLNVYERQGELAILHALGFSGLRLFLLLLARPLLTALAGALLGLSLAPFLGHWLGLLLEDAAPAISVAVHWHNAALALLFTLLLALVAGWFPALIAARQDPATIFGQE